MSLTQPSHNPQRTTITDRARAEVVRLITDDDGMSTAEYSTIRNSSHQYFRPDQRVSANPASP